MDTTKNEILTKKGSFWFPEEASTEAYHVDGLFNFILYASLILFVGIAAVLFYFVKKYKRTSENQVAQAQVIHNTALEITWTVIPIIIVMFLFYWGFTGYLKMTVPPPNASEIRVTAKKWMWQFDYPNGNKAVGELVVPVDTPIRLVMSSEDVIHSFFVPNFRIKRDVIPNRYTRIWFEANRTGQFQIFCTEYCGDGHSDMLGSIRVLSKADYAAWLKEANSGADLPLDKLGEKVYTSKGCNTCHSTDGSAKTGPTWKGLYGANRSMADGKAVKADDNYLRESMVDPKAKVVAGFQPVMPTFAGLLNDREITGVIEYIKTLK
jgi:cytochrome c oxidase subunit 2